MNNPGHDTAAAALVAMKARIYETNHELAQLAGYGNLTGADIDAVLALQDELSAACERFRRKYYPRRARLFTASGSVVVASATGRSMRIVYEAPDTSSAVCTDRLSTASGLLAK